MLAHYNCLIDTHYTMKIYVRKNISKQLILGVENILFDPHFPDGMLLLLVHEIAFLPI